MSLGEGREWHLEHSAQNTYLWHQLEALRAAPNRVWRKYRRLEYVCRRCGAAFVQVMTLDPYLTAYYMTEPPGGTLGREYALLPLDPGSPANARRVMPAQCRCARRLVSVGDLLADLEAGNTKRAFESPRRDD